MNWSDERYVRVYVRDTTDWLLWTWQARALFVLLLRKADRSGVIALGRHGVKGVVALTSIPWEVAEPALAELLEDGCLEHRDGGLHVRNFEAAQEATASPRRRQQDWREKASTFRNETSTPNAPSTPRNGTSRVNGHASRCVDVASPNVDELRRGETSGDSVPYCTVPYLPPYPPAPQSGVTDPESEPEKSRRQEPPRQPWRQPQTAGSVQSSTPQRCTSCKGPGPFHGGGLCTSCFAATSDVVDPAEALSAVADMTRKLRGGS